MGEGEREGVRMNKTRLGVIFGSRSGEYEISLMSGAAVIAAVTPVKRGETVAGTVLKQKIGFWGIALRTEENLPDLSRLGRNEKWRRERDSNPR